MTPKLDTFSIFLFIIIYYWSINFVIIYELINEDADIFLQQT